MSDDTIYMTDVLEQMRSLDEEGRAVPFSMKVRTLQKNSRTGGKMITYPKAKMVMAEENPNRDSIMALRTKRTSRTGISRDPDHFGNKTRNIKTIPGGDIRKIHIRYIVEFNGKKVIY